VDTVRFPKWKQRALKAKAELESAEQSARHKAFWDAVKKPKFFEDQPDFDEYRERRPITDWDLPIG
jgi:hypothetical protein